MSEPARNDSGSPGDVPVIEAHRDIVMRKSTIPAAAIVACMSLMGVHVATAADSMLDRAGLLHRVVGNTIHYQGPSEDVFEYLAADGRIHGESSVHGKYSARWRFHERDAICFEHDDPMTSGCVAVVLRGQQIEYHRRDGVIEGPFEMLAGNPRKL